MQLNFNLYVQDLRTHFYTVTSVTSLASLITGSFEYLITTLHTHMYLPTGSDFFVWSQIKQDAAGSVMDPGL